MTRFNIVAHFLEKRFSAKVTKIYNLGSNFWVQKLDLTINFSNWQPKTNFSGQNMEKMSHNGDISTAIFLSHKFMIFRSTDKYYYLNTLVSLEMGSDGIYYLFLVISTKKSDEKLNFCVLVMLFAKCVLVPLKK